MSGQTDTAYGYDSGSEPSVVWQGQSTSTVYSYSTYVDAGNATATAAHLLGCVAITVDFQGRGSAVAMIL